MIKFSGVFAFKNRLKTIVLPSSTDGIGWSFSYTVEKNEWQMIHLPRAYLIYPILEIDWIDIANKHIGSTLGFL